MRAERRRRWRMIMAGTTASALVSVGGGLPGASVPVSVAAAVMAAGASTAAGASAAASFAAAQDTPRPRPDLGVRRPPEPPATRYAAASIEQAADEQRGLLRRLAPTAGEARDLVAAADALRAIAFELAYEADTARPNGRADVVLAGQIMAEAAIWDEMFRRSLAGGEASEGATTIAAFVTAIDPGPESGRVPARDRLAAASRTLLSATAGFGSAAAMMDAVAAADAPDMAAAGGRAGPVDPFDVAARLEAAMVEASWLGTDRERLTMLRRADVASTQPPHVMAMADLAAGVIETINAAEPRGRRRARFRAAVRQIIDRWPEGRAAVINPDDAPRPSRDAEPVSDAETREAWTRLGRVAELAARRIMIGARPAPPNLPPELRRLGRVLFERADEADLATIDAVDELLYGADAMSDPALVSIVSQMQQAVDRLDWLSAREGWLATVDTIDPELREPARARIDEWLVQLGSPALRVEAGERLNGLADFLAAAGDDAARSRIRRSIDGNGERALAELLGGDGPALIERGNAAVRGQLALLLGRPAAPDAEAADAITLLARQLVAVADARVRLDTWGSDAANAAPDAFFPGGGDVLIGAGERAVRVALTRALDAAPASIIDAVIAARAPVAGAVAWADAVPRWEAVPGGADLAPLVVGSSSADDAAAERPAAERPAAADQAANAGLPPIPASLLAACVPPSRGDLAALSWHALESAAATVEDDADVAAAHAATAAWIRQTAFAAGRDAEAGGGW